MALKLIDLNNSTREFMLKELQADIETDQLYLSNRLSQRGRDDYSELLAEAIQQRDDTWLAGELATKGRMNRSERRRKPKGGFAQAKVPYNAHETLAEGEFNRFYLRGLARRALAEEIAHLVIYRAKAVRDPRPRSRHMEGQLIRADALLNDLRTHPGVDSALGLPSGPNSGLSAKLPAES